MPVVSKHRARCVVLLGCALACQFIGLWVGDIAVAATWQMAAGPTRHEGGAIEIARSTPHWETALGYISDQSVTVHTVQQICIARVTGPDCIDQTGTAARTVTRYAYLSLQRRFTFGSNSRLQPVFGIGAVASSDTNPYVSSPLTFSLSIGLRLGRQWSVEWRHFSNAGLAQPNLGQDMLLLRARFGQ